MKSNHQNAQIFIKHIKQQPLSVICYILYHIYDKHENTDLAFSVDPLCYIFRYENKYTLFGEDVWELEKKIRWFDTNIVLTFEKQNWRGISKRFDNFRSIEAKKPITSYKTYLTLNLTREHFSFFESSENQIIQIPSPGYPLPKRYRPLSGGLNFAFFKNDNIVCFASAPYILTQSSFSFAILRGIETKLPERKKGYAFRTVGVLCKELFSRYSVSNIFLWVEETNPAALNLYRHLGFSEESKVLTTYCDKKK